MGEKKAITNLNISIISTTCAGLLPLLLLVVGQILIDHFCALPFPLTLVVAPLILSISVLYRHFPFALSCVRGDVMLQISNVFFWLFYTQSKALAPPFILQTPIRRATPSTTSTTLRTRPTTMSDAPQQTPGAETLNPMVRCSLLLRRCQIFYPPPLLTPPLLLQGGNLPTEDAVDVKPGQGDIKDIPGAVLLVVCCYAVGANT